MMTSPSLRWNTKTPRNTKGHKPEICGVQKSGSICPQKITTGHFVKLRVFRVQSDGVDIRLLHDDVAAAEMKHKDTKEHEGPQTRDLRGSEKRIDLPPENHYGALCEASCLSCSI